MDHQRLHALARRRGGVLSLDDAAELGLSRAALAARARRQHWARPSPGVVVLPGTPPDFLRAVLVVLRTTGTSRILVGGMAAAYLWGMVRRPPRRIDVVIPMSRHEPKVQHLRLPVEEQGRVFTATVRLRRSRTLVRADAVHRGLVPLTSPARTIVDLAADLSVDDLRSVVIDARQRRIVQLDDVRGVHERIPVYPGRGAVRRVLRDLDAETCDSSLEWDFRKAARARGFRPHPHHFPFRCSDGVVIHIDVAFPAQWVAVECDGFGSHAERNDLVVDHLRQNRAVADGWRPFRVDWTRLKQDTDRFFAELDALLATPPSHPEPPPMDESAARRNRGRRPPR